MGISSRRKRRRDAPRNGGAEAAIERFIYEIRRIRAAASDGGGRTAQRQPTLQVETRPAARGTGTPKTWHEVNG